MGKSRDLFKKIRDAKGTLNANMGSIKDKDGMDLIEAEYIKKRWQEYTEELCKRDLNDTDKHDAVITHLEQVILVGSQVVLRKHHYEQSQWRWWNSSWAISNPKR